MTATPPRNRRPRRPSAQSPARAKAKDHAALWRTVEGAVADTFNCHPDYLTVKGRLSAVESVTKRVVGQIISLAIHEVRNRDDASPACVDGGFGSSGVDPLGYEDDDAHLVSLLGERAEALLEVSASRDGPIVPAPPPPRIIRTVSEWGGEV